MSVTQSRVASDGRDREATARRLNQSSVEHSYDPVVDIDWEAPVDPALRYHPDELVSLYGTALWETMTPAQRRDLARLESGWNASQGIVAEIGLMTQLLRVATMDPLSQHGQYALTEMADECRHSTMFSRSVSKLREPGDPPTRQPIPRPIATIARVLGILLPDSPTGWASLLYVEDTLDKLQRETMNDERLQPIVRMVNRIHVIEEARHMTYAREELQRTLDSTGRIGLQLNRVLVGLMVLVSSRVVVPPFAYEAVGLNPEEAMRQARENPNRHSAARRHAERYVKTMDAAGLIAGRFTTSLWRRSGLLG